MVSDTVRVTNVGDGIYDALALAEKTAAYASLDDTDALHLRLLSEELMSLMLALTGEREGTFAIECEGGEFRLRLRIRTVMDPEKREKLLSVSTTGRNASVKGVSGRIRDFLERALEKLDSEGFQATPRYQGSLTNDYGAFNANAWSLNRYIESVTRDGTTEERDELERSVIARLSDEVSVGIADGLVETVISKKFKEV